MTTKKPYTFTFHVKNGLIAGVVAALLNVGYSICFQFIHPDFPEVLTLIAICIASIMPIIFSSILYYLLNQITHHSTIIFIAIVTLVASASCYGPYAIEQLPNGMAKPELFEWLTIPMHAIAGLVAIWFVPRN